MWKIRDFLRKFNDNKILQLLFCVTCVLVSFLVYVFVLSNIKERKAIAIEEQIDNHIMVEIEEANGIEGMLEFSGWALRLNSYNEEIKMILRPVDGKEEMVLDTKTYDRKDVKTYYGREFDFGKCGFLSYINEEKICEEVCYEILVVLEYSCEAGSGYEIGKKTVKVFTEQYLYNGKVYRFNPKEFWTPEVGDDKIRRAITEGVLLACDLEKEIWIYFFDDQIYFISNYEAIGSLDPRPSIPFSAYSVNMGAKKYILLQEQISEEYYLQDTDCIKANKYFVHSFSLDSTITYAYFSIGIWGNKEGARDYLWIKNIQGDSLLRNQYGCFY